MEDPLKATCIRRKPYLLRVAETPLGRGYPACNRLLTRRTIGRSVPCMKYSSLTTGQLEVRTRTPRPTYFANQRAASQMSYLNSRRAEGTFVLISWLLFLAVPLYAGVPGSTSPINLDASGLALRGYDPVAYFETGEPTRGVAKITASYGGARYFFATNAHRKSFLNNPTNTFLSSADSAPWEPRSVKRSMLIPRPGRS